MLKFKKVTQGLYEYKADGLHIELVKESPKEWVIQYLGETDALFDKYIENFRFGLTLFESKKSALRYASCDVEEYKKAILNQ